MKKLKIDGEMILYIIRNRDPISTPELNDTFIGRYDIDRSRVNYIVRKMTEVGLIEMDKSDNIGSAKATNIYRPNLDMIEEYESEHGDVAIPPFVLMDRIETLERKAEYNMHYVQEFIRTHNEDKIESFKRS
jgi:hypothetical protein